MSVVEAVIKFVGGLDYWVRLLVFVVWVLIGFAWIVLGYFALVRDTPNRFFSSGSDPHHTEEATPAITPERTVEVPRAAAPAPADSPQTPPPPSPSISILENAHIAGDVVFRSLPVAGGEDVQRVEVQVESDDGARAEVHVYLLFDRAAWAFKRVDSYVDQRPRTIDIDEFLDADVFAKSAPGYQALVCLGTESSFGDDAEGDRSDERARDLCLRVAGKPYINRETTSVFGVGLGQHSDTGARKQTAKERRERGAFIVGVKGLEGAYLDETRRNEMIAAVLQQDVLLNDETGRGFRLSNYERVANRESLRFIRVSWGTMRL